MADKPKPPKKPRLRSVPLGEAPPKLPAPVPVGPPPLADLTARRDKWQEDRETFFPVWKEALEAAGGNVTAASAATWPQMPPKKARWRGDWYTKLFGLREFAAELRVKTTGNAMGRQDR